MHTNRQVQICASVVWSRDADGKKNLMRNKIPTLLLGCNSSAYFCAIAKQPEPFDWQTTHLRHLWTTNCSICFLHSARALHDSWISLPGVTCQVQFSKLEENFRTHLFYVRDVLYLMTWTKLKNELKDEVVLTLNGSIQQVFICKQIDRACISSDWISLHCCSETRTLVFLTAAGYYRTLLNEVWINLPAGTFWNTFCLFNTYALWSFLLENKNTYDSTTLDCLEVFLYWRITACFWVLYFKYVLNVGICIFTPSVSN